MHVQMACVYACVYDVCMHVSVCVYLVASVCACMCMCVCNSVCDCVCMLVRVCACVCVRVCVITTHILPTYLGFFCGNIHSCSLSSESVPSTASCFMAYSSFVPVYRII